MVLNFVVFLQRASAKIRSLPMALWNKPSRTVLWVDKLAQALRWTTEQQLESWRCAHCHQTPPCPGIGSQTALGHECRHAHPAWAWAAVSHSPNRQDLTSGSFSREPITPRTCDTSSSAAPVRERNAAARSDIQLTPEQLGRRGRGVVALSPDENPCITPTPPKCPHQLPTSGSLPTNAVD